MTAASHALPVPSASGARILLVDDDPMIREIYGDALRDEGHDVVTADCHDSAAALLDTSPAPDLLITDIDLGPGKSGLDLIENAKIRRAPIPVLLISGHHPAPAPAPLLPKPFRLADLLATVTTLLHGSARAAGGE